MKQFLVILFSVLSMSFLQAQNVLPKPNPAKLVTDMAGVLSAEQKAILENKLVALDDSSSNQIAIVLVKTLDGYPIEEYATKLFREWGIGNKKTNNGVLILASIDERKIRIEVGYGLEGAIPDITTASIIRNDIVPSFKTGEYYHGLDLATNSLSKAAVGEYKVQREKVSKGKGSGGGSLITFLIILVIVIALVSGGGRGGGGGMMSRRGAGNIAETLFWTSLLSGGGGSRGGGFAGGGGFGGGGGGFGGFGGGSSGGGGASGSW
jgi:uncharacterized protein